MRRRIPFTTHFTSPCHGAGWPNVIVAAVANAPPPVKSTATRSFGCEWADILPPRAHFTPQHALLEPKRFAHSQAPATTAATSEEQQRVDTAATNSMLRSAIDEIIEFQSAIDKKPEGAARVELLRKGSDLRFHGSRVVVFDVKKSLDKALAKFAISYHHDVYRQLPFLFHRDAIVASLYSADPLDPEVGVYLLLSEGSFDGKVPRRVVSHRGWFAVGVSITTESTGADEAAFVNAIVDLCLGATIKHRLLAHRAQELKFPSFFGQAADDTSEFRMSLRPYPTRLTSLSYSLDAHRIPNEKDGSAPTESLEAFTRYPFVLNGTSGSGKTVAALQLAEAMCAKREEQFGCLKEQLQKKPMEGVCDRQLSSFDPRHVIGCYVKVPQWGTRDVSYADYDASGSIEQCRMAADLAAKVAQTVSGICGRLGIVVPEGGFDLSGVHLHIVLDEMGELPNLVRLIVRDHSIFCGMVREQLAALRGAGGGKVFKFGTGGNVGGAGLVSDLTVTTAVVGTGVDSAGIRNGSIGQPLWRVFVRTSPHAFLEEKGLAECVSKVPVLHALASNFRCAAILGDKLWEVGRSFSSRIRSADIRPVAGMLMEAVVNEYIRAGGWGGLSANNAVLRSAQVISLLFTQHYMYEAFPCHLLGDGDIEVLCGKLGAIDDRLCWGDSKPADGSVTLSPLAHNNAKYKGFYRLYAAPPEACKSPKYARIRPRSTAPNTNTTATTHWCQQQHPNLRFDVPPAIAIIALTQFAKHHGRHPFAGDLDHATTPSATCDSLTAVALSSPGVRA